MLLLTIEWNSCQYCPSSPVWQKFDKNQSLWSKTSFASPIEKKKKKSMKAVNRSLPLYVRLQVHLGFKQALLLGFCLTPHFLNTRAYYWYSTHSLLWTIYWNPWVRLHLLNFALSPTSSKHPYILKQKWDKKRKTHQLGEYCLIG